jgi:mono/diheme cytochrome c family protein
MRHVIANALTYAIATLLVAGSAFFAWLRSEQVTVTTEAVVLAGYEPTDATFEWFELGRSSYIRNCANCHLRDGSGWDQYPDLTAAGAMLETEQGRAHLIELHLYGLTSRRFGAPMPPMGHIRDVELAAVINYIAATFGEVGDDRLLVPADVAEHRGQRLSPADVERRRPLP